ncbi:MAG: hypothetical protein QF662_04360, partial [Phycisphaerae bacterium]|nr:hypothetical protein [Phycisphaerae bacterium]
MATFRRANLNKRKTFIAALGLMSVVLLLLPRQASDNIRVWVAPIFQPAQGLAHRWSLDLAGGARRIRESLA